MRVIKWIGYIVAAALMLSLLVGIGLFIATVGAAIAAVLMVVFGVGFLAFLIKETVDPAEPGPTGSGDP